MEQSQGKDAVAPEQVVGLKHFKRLMPLLHRLDEVGCERDKSGNRRLLMSDYCAVVMLYLFNPLVDSLRMLQATVGLPQVAKALGIKRFSLGSFSESVRVFEPEKLKAIVEELARELRPLSKDPRLSELKHALTLVDGTALTGLSRLSGAACEQTRYNTAKDGRAVHGWRLHTQLDLELFCPRRLQVTGAANAGQGRESQVLRQSLEPGRCYVGDGGYAQRQLCDDIVKAASSYLCRYSVELFFRLFKQVMGMRHLLSQRQEGVEIQVYCCVIACMLISLQTGKKPSKLMRLMVGWYLLGVAQEQDVINFLNKPDNTGVKLKAKAELWKKLGF